MKASKVTGTLTPPTQSGGQLLEVAAGQQQPWWWSRPSVKHALKAKRTVRRVRHQCAEIAAKGYWPCHWPWRGDYPCQEINRRTKTIQFLIGAWGRRRSGGMKQNRDGDVPHGKERSHPPRRRQPRSGAQASVVNSKNLHAKSNGWIRQREDLDSVHRRNQ